jgi:ribosomal protein S18 acetylase RimI-like enzyme
MRLTLREATPEDYAAIVRLLPSEEELFLVYPRGKHPFSREQVCELAQQRLDLTVMVNDGEVIGFADLYDLQPGEWVFIGNLIIDRAFRGKGHGRRLIGHMEHLARDKHRLPQARISVFNPNTPALLLYSGLGYVPYAIERRQDPCGTHIGLIHMRKSLVTSANHGDDRLE